MQSNLFFHRPVYKVISVVALLLIVIFGVMWFTPSLHQRFADWIQQELAIMHIGPSRPTILLRGNNTNVAYVLSGTILVPLHPSTSKTNPPLRIDENAPALALGTPVIVSPQKNESASSRLVGLLTGKTFVQLAVASSDARDISARPDSWIGFADHMHGDSSPSTWHIFVVNGAGQGTEKDVGVGQGPVFAANGNMLAFAPQGLVEINLFVNDRRVRLGVPYAGSADPFFISPQATYAVLPNTVTHREDVYSINPTQPSDISYLGKLPGIPVAIGALSADSFVVEVDATHAVEYTIGTSSIQVGRRFSISQ